MLLLFLKSLILGFSIAAPVGPVGLLCIRKTLNEGKRAGFICGLGSAVADALYGAIAVFGLTAISSMLLSYQKPIQYIGSILLFYIALKIFWAKPHIQAEKNSNKSSLLKTFISSFMLTITNPVTFLGFIAVFAGLGVISSGMSWIGSTLIVVGVFLGATLCWLTLCIFFGMIKHRVSSTILSHINKGFGVLIGILGIVGLLGSV